MKTRTPVHMVLIFLTIFLALQYGWQKSRGSEFEHLIIDHVTVGTAAAIIDHLWPDEGVVASGHSLVSPNARLNILNGCEGLEMLFQLVAALLTYPFPLRVRVGAILAGLPVVFAFNQMRIMVLWKSFVAAPGYFGLLHGLAMPVLMIVALLAYFLFVMAWHARAGG